MFTFIRVKSTHLLYWQALTEPGLHVPGTLNPQLETGTQSTLVNKAAWGESVCRVMIVYTYSAGPPAASRVSWLPLGYSQAPLGPKEEYGHERSPTVQALILLRHQVNDSHKLQTSFLS